MKSITYIEKLCKYILVENASIDLKQYCGWEGIPNLETKYICIKDGILAGKEGYGWDGCSGPTWDDASNMRGGLFHDILYQLMRLGLIPETYKEAADKLLRDLIKEDSYILYKRGKIYWIQYRFCLIRAWYYYSGVDHFAHYAAKYGTEPVPRSAPV